MLDREQIQQIIPHRPPFLWLDEIVELGEDRIRARKSLDPELDVFAGHYPHRPVLPGVLQCEAAFQAAAVLIARTQRIPGGAVPVVTRLSNTKFRQMVGPGETLEIDVTLDETLSGAFYLTGRIAAGGRQATRLEFACTTTPAE